MKIGIVGAGPTGLTAGYQLVKAGHQVQVFESEPDYGGLVSPVQVGERRLEKFYHHIFTVDTEFIKLAKELNLTVRILWRVSRNGIYINGRLYPFSSPRDLLLFRELTLWERVTMGLLIYRAGRINDWGKLDYISAKEWITRMAGAVVYEKVWAPLLKSKFDDDAEDISAAWIWNKFKQRSATRSSNLQRELLGYMEGSFMVLYDRLSEEIRKGGGEVLLREAVKEITFQSDKTLVVSSQTRKERFDRVIVTLPPAVLPTILLQLPEDYRTKLERIEYKANICLVLELSEPLSAYYWITVAQKDAPFVAIIEHTNLFPDIGYGGHIVYLSRYIRPQDELYTAPDAKVEEVFLSYLKKIFPEWKVSGVRGSRIYRNAYAQPVVTVGYSRKIPDYRTPIAHLYLASMARIYPEDRGQNYALRIGKEVAKVAQETD